MDSRGGGCRAALSQTHSNGASQAREMLPNSSSFSLNFTGRCCLQKPKVLRFSLALSAVLVALITAGTLRKPSGTPCLSTNAF